MNYRLTAALAAGAALTLVPMAAEAQRQAPPTPEQRLDRLEKQVQQVQRQVFPKGRPADTAGFSDDPAATQSSVVTLDQRLDAVEKQMAEVLNLPLGTLKSRLFRARLALRDELKSYMK